MTRFIFRYVKNNFQEGFQPYFFGALHDFLILLHFLIIKLYFTFESTKKWSKWEHSAGARGRSILPLSVISLRNNIDMSCVTPF
jgi:hypothetical protein